MKRLTRRVVVGAVVAVPLVSLLPAQILAQEVFPNFHYSRAGQPTDPDTTSLHYLATEAGNTVVVNTGDVSYTDPSGNSFAFPGKSLGEDRASVVVVIGPAGAANGGADVFLTLTPRYQWTGVTANPEGKSSLAAGELATLVNTQVRSFRDPVNNNGINGGALTGIIDIAVIDGKTGLIRYTWMVYPNQEIVE